MKIHANRLATGEKKKLLSYVSKIKELKFTSYSLDKIKQRGISVDTLGETITKGRLIEYHIKEDTRRVLLRCKGGTCAVVDLDKESIITAYKNDPNYNHPHLDQTKYLFGA